MIPAADLIAAALELARRCGAHVFNALELGELTPELLRRMGFGEGDSLTHISIEGEARLKWRGGLKSKEVAWLPMV